VPFPYNIIFGSPRALPCPLYHSGVVGIDMKSDRTTGTIAIEVCAQSNGQYLCQMSSSLNDRPNDSMNFYGQTKEHAIAIALEHLAGEYREKAEKSQNID
jgi:hypothetical protein